MEKKTDQSKVESSGLPQEFSEIIMPTSRWALSAGESLGHNNRNYIVKRMRGGVIDTKEGESFGYIRINDTGQELTDAYSLANDPANKGKTYRLIIYSLSQSDRVQDLKDKFKREWAGRI